MAVDKAARMNLLYDFYGALLTAKQRQAMEMHYGEDLSLGEIAAVLGISRQAVHDLLSRTEAILENYEAALGLMRKHGLQQAALRSLREHLRQLPRLSGSEQAERLRTALAIVQGLLDD